MARYHVGQDIGNGAWDEWTMPECCFLCGKPFHTGDELISWCGCLESEKMAFPFASRDIHEMSLMDGLAKKSGGFQKALTIAFCVDCVPSFCRRLLQDWERV